MEVEYLARRQKVKGLVKGCQLCGLSAAHTPVPFDGPLHQTDILIVGEAPGEQEDKKGRPFVGPAGRKARVWLETVGLNPVDCAWMNVVSCYPERTPTTKEVTACVPNVLAQWDLIDPKYVLVFGGVALSALCPVKTRITEAAGYFWRPNVASLRTSVWAMATYHPAAVLRNASLEDKALEDLEYFALVAKREVDPVEHVYCMKCKKAEVEKYHTCGLGFCARCWGLSVK